MKKGKSKDEKSKKSKDSKVKKDDENKSDKSAASKSKSKGKEKDASKGKEKAGSKTPTKKEKTSKKSPVDGQSEISSISQTPVAPAYFPADEEIASTTKAHSSISARLASNWYATSAQSSAHTITT